MSARKDPQQQQEKSKAFRKKVRLADTRYPHAADATTTTAIDEKAHSVLCTRCILQILLFSVMMLMMLLITLQALLLYQCNPHTPAVPFVLLLCCVRSFLDLDLPLAQTERVFFCVQFVGPLYSSYYYCWLPYSSVASLPLIPLYFPST